MANLFHGGIELGLTPASDEDMRAFCDEPLRGGEAYAAVASRDDCDFSREFLGHKIPPLG
jgi:hypothetical protein